MGRIGPEPVGATGRRRRSQAVVLLSFVLLLWSPHLYAGAFFLTWSESPVDDVASIEWPSDLDAWLIAVVRTAPFGMAPLVSLLLARVAVDLIRAGGEV